MARLHEASVDLKFRRAMRCQLLPWLRPWHVPRAFHENNSGLAFLKSSYLLQEQYNIYIYIYTYIYKCLSDGQPPGSSDGRPRGTPSAWLTDLLEKLPSKSSKHTKQVFQSHQASLPSKSFEQVFHPSTCVEDLLGRLARKTCLGDVFGIIARILAKRTPFWTAHEGIDTIRAKDVSIAMATQVISFVVVGTHTAKGN